MLDPRVGLDDLKTFWKGCIALYKGEPVFVIGVGLAERKGYVAQIKELKTGEIHRVNIEEGTLTPPDGRLGYVNLNGTIIYTQRKPVRRFMMGINDGNLAVKKLVNYIHYERGEIHDLSTTSMEFYRTLVGDYPTLAQAIEQTKTFGGACAFERQFAVDENRHLYYKTYLVGQVGRGAVDRRGLILKPEFKYLTSVIGEFSYEEAARTVGL